MSLRSVRSSAPRVSSIRLRAARRIPQGASSHCALLSLKSRRPCVGVPFFTMTAALTRNAPDDPGVPLSERASVEGAFIDTKHNWSAGCLDARTRYGLNGIDGTRRSPCKRPVAGWLTGACQMIRAPHTVRVLQVLHGAGSRNTSELLHRTLTSGT